MPARSTQSNKAQANTMTLFTNKGERKYLNAAERKRFYRALCIIEDLAERSFCETIYWTGCRISEALQLEIARVDLDEGCLIFRSLKKHGKNKGKHFRAVPVPREFIRSLNRIHLIRRIQRAEDGNVFVRLWTFGRQKGWRLIRRVMTKAKIFGICASSRGLRHSFGVHAILSGVPELRLQEWLGHADLETTAIYVSVSGAENRAIAARMWKQEASD